MFLGLTSSWLSGQLPGGHWPGPGLGNIEIMVGRTGNVIERAVTLMIGILSQYTDSLRASPSDLLAGQGALGNLINSPRQLCFPVRFLNVLVFVFMWICICLLKLSQRNLSGMQPEFRNHNGKQCFQLWRQC